MTRLLNIEIRTDKSIVRLAKPLSILELKKRFNPIIRHHSVKIVCSLRNVE
jgi:hypothetical protein